jgi:hypothetical protein
MFQKNNTHDKEWILYHGYVSKLWVWNPCTSLQRTARSVKSQTLISLNLLFFCLFHETKVNMHQTEGQKI